MRMQRPLAAVAAACLGCAAAAAQPPPAAKDENRLQPDLRTPPGRTATGMLAAVPVGEGAAFGFGRFSVAEPPRPRTNLEPVRDPSDITRRRRGIGGLGLRIAF